MRFGFEAGVLGGGLEILVREVGILGEECGILAKGWRLLGEERKSGIYL